MLSRLVCAVLIGVWSGTAAAGQSPASQKPPAAERQAGTKPSGQPAKGEARSAKFDALVEESAKARTGGDIDRAIELYRQALAIRPAWLEGRWNLGTALYEIERFGEARDAFRRVLAAHPENGTAWALKALCEFRLQNFDTALADLLKAKTHGVVGGQAVAEVARYHTAILLTRIGQFDQALLILNDFGLEGNDSPGVIEAMGLAVLRLPMLPQDLPGPRRELVLMAGRARFAVHIGPACLAFCAAAANSSFRLVPDQNSRSNSSLSDFTRFSANSLRKMAAQLATETPSSNSMTSCTTQLACSTRLTMDMSWEFMQIFPARR